MTRKDTPRRNTSFFWLAVSFCALGILMAAFFNLGASSGNQTAEMADFPLLPIDGY